MYACRRVRVNLCGGLAPPCTRGHSHLVAEKFDPSRLDRLNNPGRTRYMDIGLMWKGFGVESPRSVVDIGAGTGFFAVRFAPLLAPGGTVHACDTSRFMVDWMRANLGPAQLQAVAPRQVEEARIDLPDGSADLVTMINVFHELADPVATLREARRLLRPGAPAAVIDWKNEDTSFDGERHGPPPARRVSPAAIRAALGEAGFTDIRALDSLPLHTFLVARDG
jgi:ubiquinone/menaquinone biosynthesis C-methylase UbiE